MPGIWILFFCQNEELFMPMMPITRRAFMSLLLAWGMSLELAACDKTRRAQQNSLSRTPLMNALRAAARPFWTEIEAGGIFLLADARDETRNRAAFKRFLPYFPSIRDNGSDLWMAPLADALANACDDFFAHAVLASGIYTLDNYHRHIAVHGEIPFDADGDPPLKIPDTPQIRFTLKAEHLRLIRHMNTRAWDGHVELMNPKRPYGDMTDDFIDMADALGEPVPRDAHAETAEFPPALLARYLQLYREMLFAVQAFWTFAQYPSQPSHSQ